MFIFLRNKNKPNSNAPGPDNDHSTEAENPLTNRDSLHTDEADAPIDATVTTDREQDLKNKLLRHFQGN